MAYTVWTRMRVYDYTHSTDLNIYSLNHNCMASANYQGTLTLDGYFTLTSTSEIELQYLCGSNASNFGQGMAGSLGINERYASVELWKVA